MSRQKDDHLPLACFVCLVALALPVILIPIEAVIPYPFIIEEIAKAILILLIFQYSFSLKHRLQLTFLTILLFAFSENMFYLANFVANENTGNFWIRFVLTSPLHLLTGIIFLIFLQINRWLTIPAVFLATVIHWLYNHLVAILF